MRRKEKRLLQAVALVLAALVLLPNVGLWALYRERQPDSTPGGPGAAVAPAAGQGSHNQQKKIFFLGDGQKLKDWHDKEAIRRDAQRVGNGEQGRPYPMTDAERVDQAYRENGFNIYVSDKISLNRSLPDIRHPNCNSKRYLETLPNTSIIIPFHNEGWSSLLRTVHSVLNRSPPELIAEIVLVDDFSDREHLKKPLEDYMAHFPSVRILRTKKREGLIRTRMLGASAAIGDVITFLDSHCEANVNWLPPLLDRIARNRKTIVCPMIDVIDHDDFRYETQAGDAMRGAFDWEMYYKRIPIPPELQKADPSDPFESPVMAGGLFAVDRKWFWELGGYDPGLEIWGGEQYEISFKVWMCGGRMEDIPCSRVGHIYRKYVPYKVPAGVSLARFPVPFHQLTVCVAPHSIISGNIILMDLRRDIPKALRGTDKEGSRGLAEVVPTPGQAARQQRGSGAGWRGSPPARLPPEQAATWFTNLLKAFSLPLGKGS
ncbi:polypeptide N-acetylgalactosaminyltransferase 10 isoform X5 [Myotis lucifugus]|uniref:polypeptide N-acetylgalactosaminyltransferase 10 isoform X5 n=1 Tax=Myotis lucifugus TaxID=59463 RepID=UPI000CCC5F84|nr:polypeptide N-acetylgalactosaminyltransferase 10 isoform X5 [Myotis lucifugus]